MNKEINIEVMPEELQLIQIYETKIKGHTFEEAAFGYDCENEIADMASAYIDDNTMNAPEQAEYMDPSDGFDPDEAVRKIALENNIPTKAVYDALDLIYAMREYQDLHMKVYGIPTSVMLN